MSVSGISKLSMPIKKLPSSTLPINLILNIQRLLKKSIFSRKFYQEINDKVLNKSSSVDTNLYFICYFSLLISAIFNNKHKILFFLKDQWFKFTQLIKSTTGEQQPQQQQSQEINDEKINNSKKSYIEKILNPSKPIYIEGKPSQLAYNLKKISSYLADIRIFNRLTDSIKYMPWVIDEYHSFKTLTSPIPKLDRFVNLLQSINCVVLELLENAGWLTDHDFISTNDNPWWSFETYIWCCRVWGFYLVLEIIELIRRTPVNKWGNKSWQINLFKNVIQIPLVLHWSLREGCLSPFWVGVCGAGASWWNFKDMWSSIDLS